MFKKDKKLMSQNPKSLVTTGAESGHFIFIHIGIWKITDIFPTQILASQALVVEKVK
jgi:hypothetical protein